MAVMLGIGLCLAFTVIMFSALTVPFSEIEKAREDEDQIRFLQEYRRKHGR